MQLDFNFAVDETAAINPNNFKISRWNYKWSGGYGSKQYPLGSDKAGEPTVSEVTKVEVGQGGKSIFLHVPDMQPVDQMRIALTLPTADGETFEETALSTINALP